jgi:phytoene dehydrogenase-like protein
VSRAPVTVIGGGLAGLVAAISCAEAGLPVCLFEARHELGGRARSTDGNWNANFGPHGLCSARQNWTWLKERGLLPKTAWISPTESRFHYDGRLRRTPPSSLLAAFGSMRKTAPADASFGDWARAEMGAGAARATARLAAASFSYHHDPSELSARFVWERLRWIFMPPALHRVIGGWNALVDRLVSRAREVSVEIICERKIDTLPAPPAIVATTLDEAARLLGRDLSWPSGGGLAFDLGLEHRRGDAATVLDLDHGVLVQAQHPSAAPHGHRLYQAHVAIRPGESPDDALEKIEDVFDHACRAWRERTAWRRRMVVSGRTGALDYPATTWRDRPSIEQGDGVFLAGDMVASDGLLSEVASNSAVEAARRATAWAEAATNGSRASSNRCGSIT